MLIQETNRNHLPAIDEIAAATLGEGYADPEQVLEAEVSINLQIDGKVVGYGTGFVDYPNVLGSEVETLSKLYPNKTGIIGNVATHPDYQSRGIGYQITEELIRRLRAIHPGVIVASAWKSRHGINIGGVFAKLGFKEVVEIPAFWRGCSCVQCDPEECLCPAVIYELR